MYAYVYAYVYALLLYDPHSLDQGRWFYVKMTPVHVRVLTKRALPREALNSRDHPYACQIMDLGGGLGSHSI